MDDIPTTSLENEMIANVYRSNVDTTRPFRSVKEAVEIFGERFLAGEIYAPKAFSFPKPETPVCFYTPSPSPQKSQEFTSSSRSMDSVVSSAADQNPGFSEALKKLEAELEDTKAELRRLKERESETEVAVASLNAELHKNMSKMAAAEATAAAEEGRRKKGSSPSLGQMLGGPAAAADGWYEASFKKEIKKEKKVKKKPIVPMVGDLLFWKKGSSSPSSTSVLNPLFASPHRRN